MIEKIFEKSNCISCGEETPVIFIVKDLLGEPIYKIPLCRKCSNKFAEDKIDKLKQKLEYKKSNNISLKRKVKQMNIISSRHKKEITKLRQGGKENGRRNEKQNLYGT